VHVPLNVNMPNGTTIQSSHTCNLLLTDLPHQARQAHILPGLLHKSLISLGQLCDNECSVTFTQDQVMVSRNVKFTFEGPGFNSQSFHSLFESFCLDFRKSNIVAPGSTPRPRATFFGELFFPNYFFVPSLKQIENIWSQVQIPAPLSVTGVRRL
jgi:hypothetical protein